MDPPFGAKGVARLQQTDLNNPSEVLAAFITLAMDYDNLSQRPATPSADGETSEKVKSLEREKEQLANAINKRNKEVLAAQIELEKTKELLENVQTVKGNLMAEAEGVKQVLAETKNERDQLKLAAEGVNSSKVKLEEELKAINKKADELLLQLNIQNKQLDSANKELEMQKKELVHSAKLPEHEPMFKNLKPSFRSPPPKRTHSKSPPNDINGKRKEPSPIKGRTGDYSSSDEGYSAIGTRPTRFEAKSVNPRTPSPQKKAAPRGSRPEMKIFTGEPSVIVSTEDETSEDNEWEYGSNRIPLSEQEPARKFTNDERDSTVESRDVQVTTEHAVNSSEEEGTVVLPKHKTSPPSSPKIREKRVFCDEDEVLLRGDEFLTDFNQKYNERHGPTGKYMDHAEFSAYMLERSKEANATSESETSDDQIALAQMEIPARLSMPKTSDQNKFVTTTQYSPEDVSDNETITGKARVQVKGAATTQNKVLESDAASTFAETTSDHGDPHENFNSDDELDAAIMDAFPEAIEEKRRLAERLEAEQREFRYLGHKKYAELTGESPVVPPTPTEAETASYIKSVQKQEDPLVKAKMEELMKKNLMAFGMNSPAVNRPSPYPSTPIVDYDNDADSEAFEPAKPLKKAHFETSTEDHEHRTTHTQAQAVSEDSEEEQPRKASPPSLPGNHVEPENPSSAIRRKGVQFVEEHQPAHVSTGIPQKPILSKRDYSTHPFDAPLESISAPIMDRTPSPPQLSSAQVPSFEGMSKLQIELREAQKDPTHPKFPRIINGLADLPPNGVKTAPAHHNPWEGRLLPESYETIREITLRHIPKDVKVLQILPHLNFGMLDNYQLDRAAGQLKVVYLEPEAARAAFRYVHYHSIWMRSQLEGEYTWDGLASLILDDFHWSTDSLPPSVELMTAVKDERATRVLFVSGIPTEWSPMQVCQHALFASVKPADSEELLEEVKAIRGDAEIRFNSITACRYAKERLACVPQYKKATEIVYGVDTCEPRPGQAYKISLRYAKFRDGHHSSIGQGLTEQAGLGKPVGECSLNELKKPTFDDKPNTEDLQDSDASRQKKAKRSDGTFTLPPRPELRKQTSQSTSANQRSPAPQKAPVEQKATEPIITAITYRPPSPKAPKETTKAPAKAVPAQPAIRVPVLDASTIRQRSAQQPATGSDSYFTVPTSVPIVPDPNYMLAKGTRVPKIVQEPPYIKPIKNPNIPVSSYAEYRPATNWAEVFKNHHNFTYVPPGQPKPFTAGPTPTLSATAKGPSKENMFTALPKGPAAANLFAAIPKVPTTVKDPLKEKVSVNDPYVVTHEFKPTIPYAERIKQAEAKKKAAVSGTVSDFSKGDSTMAFKGDSKPNSHWEFETPVLEPTRATGTGHWAEGESQAAEAYKCVATGPTNSQVADARMLDMRKPKQDDASYVNRAVRLTGIPPSWGYPELGPWIKGGGVDSIVFGDEISSSDEDTPTKAGRPPGRIAVVIFLTPESASDYRQYVNGHRIVLSPGYTLGADSNLPRIKQVRVYSVEKVLKTQTSRCIYLEGLPHGITTQKLYKDISAMANGNEIKFEYISVTGVCARIWCASISDAVFIGKHLHKASGYLGVRVNYNRDCSDAPLKEMGKTI